jgi:hypothetical protein
MAKVQPVPKAPSPFGGRGGTVAALVGIALLLAVVKPWGSATDRTGPSPSPSAGPSAAATLSVGRDAAGVDFFGPFEPTPEWSIWPAGYFVSVMYVARAPDGAPRASHGPASTPPPALAWPARIDVGPQDHLLWLGIDTPRGRTLDSAVLRRVDRDRTERLVATRLIASPWPSHFSVVALAGGSADGALAVWQAGDYDLELAVSPGDVRRTIKIHIRTLAGPDPSHTGAQR